MNLNELKRAWQEYDTKLEIAHSLSERVIISMIKERSKSRLSKVKKHYILGVLYMVAWLVVGLAVILGNPFDFNQTFEYLPTAIFCICLSVLILTMIKTYMDLQRIEINRDTLDISLNKIIRITARYENPGKLPGWTLKLLLSVAVLFPLSFLPRKIERLGIWDGMVDTIIPVSLSVLVLFIAFKLGAFKERNGRKFKEFQVELNELKELSKELRTEM